MGTQSESAAMVHVGPHKTGTTSLQRYLRRNGYPFNPQRLWQWRDMAVVNTDVSISPSGTSAFYSWEQLSFMSADECARLIARLKAAYHRVIVIIVSRARDELHRSHRNQSVKHLGSLRPPGAVFERHLYGLHYRITDDLDISYLDIGAHVAKWSCADEVRVLPFDALAGDSYVERFFELSGLHEVIGTFRKDVQPDANDRNESLDHAKYLIATHLFMRRQNELVSEERLQECMRVLRRTATSRPIMCSALQSDNDIVVNDASISLLDFAVDLLAEIHARDEAFRVLRDGALQDVIVRCVHALVASGQHVSAHELILQQTPGVGDITRLCERIRPLYERPGMTERSLEFGERLIACHPRDWNGYARSARELTALRRFGDAEARVQQGLGVHPGHSGLLAAAIDLCRAAGDRNRALAYAEKLIAHHPHVARGHIERAKFRLAAGMGCDALSIPESVEPHGEGESAFLRAARNAARRDFGRLWMDSFRDGAEGGPATQLSFPHQPFQYWSQGKPPQDVRDNQEAWNRALAAIGSRDIMLFHRESAHEWIRTNTPALLPAFETAFHYAVEADVFRVAFALKNDCIWIDSDLYLGSQTAAMLGMMLQRSDTVLYFRERCPWLANGFFATRQASPFFERIAHTMAGYSFAGAARTARTVQYSFGPGRFNITLHGLRRSGACRSWPDRNGPGTGLVLADSWRIGFVNEYSFCGARPPGRMSYRGTDDDWHHFLRSAQ